MSYPRPGVEALRRQTPFWGILGLLTLFASLTYVGPPDSTMLQGLVGLVIIYLPLGGDPRNLITGALFVIT